MRSLLALLCSCGALGVQAATYQIDPANTSTTFEVSLLGLFSTGGKFPRSTGTITFDPSTKVGSVQVSTPVAHVELGMASSEKEVLGPDFFDAEKFPVIEFKSTQWQFNGAKLIALDGDLTLHGVTHRVTLTVTQAGCPEVVVQHDGTKKNRCRAEANVTVKRNDYGLKAWSDFLGDEVKIGVSLQANEVPDAGASLQP